jgi:hypothetical protein
MMNIAAVGLYVLLTGITGNPDAVSVPNIADQTPIVLISENRKEESTEEIDVDVEAHVRDYFSDIPILAEVARCESHFTQFTKSGKVLRGRVVPEDVGVMQINETYHLAEAKKLGFDIYTLEGNMAYARYLYVDKDLGARPWLASSKCWSKFDKLALEKDGGLNERVN